MAIYRGPGGSGDATNDASNQATVATQKAAEAEASALASANSATDSANSASSATSSASSATASASNAATSESNAATSESNAATSESNASTSASTATTQAGLATTNGAAQVALATTQVGLATTQANNASTSASNSASSASAASGSATTATTQAGIATTQASNASTSASNAATSASAAASSASAAEGYVDNFDDKYLGAKASDPATDNDGDALTDGALYYNTTENRMKVYDLGTTTWLYITLTQAEMDDVEIVADNITSVNAVSSNATNINAVNANSTNINTVATNNTNVTTVGGNIASVNTVATNVADVVTFATTYLGAFSSATIPTTSQVGALYWNTTLDQLYVWDGSAWNEAAFSISGSVTSFNTRTGAVTLSSSDVTDALTAGSIATAKIADDAITVDKIADNSVGNAQLINTEDFTVNGLTVGKGTNSVTNNTALGIDALNSGSLSGDTNTAIGRRTLNINTTGAANTAVGSDAMKNNLTGGYNSAFGFAALLNTTGGSNTGMGSYALLTNTSGVNNVAVGREALNDNTTGSQNIALGYQALANNTTASNNVAIGWTALLDNTTGYDNTAVGTFAARNITSGFENVAIGRQALDVNVTGNRNVAVGTQALASNTVDYNTAVGYAALQDNTTGTGVVAVGFSALGNNTTGSENTAVGRNALITNTTGAYNTAIGRDALYDNTSGNYNVAIGLQALENNTTASNNISIGDYSLQDNTTGAKNVALGHQALANNTTANNNTALGYTAGSTLTTGSNNTLIGYDAEPSSATVSNEVTIGNDSVTVTRLKGNVGIGTSSPLTELNVQGGIGAASPTELTTRANAMFSLSSAGTNTRLYQGVESGATVWLQAQNSDNGAKAIAINPVGGNVGIGTASPSAKLQVNGASLLGSPATFYVGDDGGSIGAFLNQTAALPIRFNTSGVERMRIDSSGNLLVGLTAASYATTTVPKLTLNAGNSSATTIQGMPCGLAIVNSHNGNSSGYGSSIKFHMSGSTAAEVTKYAAIAGIADSTFSNTTALAFYTNSSAVGGADNTAERMRIKANGNVGIGTSSPSGYAGAKLLNIYGTSSPGQLILEGGTGTNFLTAYSGISAGDLPAIYYNQGLRFGKATSKDATGFVEAMRINSNSNLLMGTTTEAANEAPLVLSKNSGTTRWAVGPFNSVPTNFYITANSAAQGVYLNGAAATSWSGLSDERYKTDLKNIENAIDKISTLRAVTGRFTEDEEQKSRSFLIAQDVQKVLPEAVDDSNPDRLGLAYTDTIPLLVAAIKEQQAIIETLTTRIEALENK